MSSGVLIDTDVLIDYLRDRREAVEYLESLSDSPAVSAITVAELYAGVREGRERTFLDEFSESLEVIDVNEDIARLGGLFRRDYFKSHGVGINDAIIAATVELEDRTFITLNEKHFPMLRNKLVPYKK
ncbi:MAG TPA: type II toxin-antitoxin system VapC family toxin [Pyrinomonadaceae bacterium]